LRALAACDPDPVSEGYNQFSGRTLDRVQALADGVFAVAMAALATFASPVAAIGALAAVQLFFIVSPRIPFRV